MNLNANQLLSDGSGVLGLGMSATLHGLFALAKGVSEAEFVPAFEAFYQHLHELGFVRSYRLRRRQPLPGKFGAALPPFELHLEIEFASLAADAACYEYVARDKEPVRSLHRAMNSKVRRGAAHFFLTAP
jgi:hypothetical protein